MEQELISNIEKDIQKMRALASIHFEGPTILRILDRLEQLEKEYALLLKLPAQMVDITGTHLNKKISDLLATQNILVKAAYSALLLIRGSGFTDNTKAVIELKNALSMVRGEE